MFIACSSNKHKIQLWLANNIVYTTAKMFFTVAVVSTYVSWKANMVFNHLFKQARAS